MPNGFHDIGAICLISNSSSLAVKNILERSLDRNVYYLSSCDLNMFVVGYMPYIQFVNKLGNLHQNIIQTFQSATKRKISPSANRPKNSVSDFITMERQGWLEGICLFIIYIYIYIYFFDNIHCHVVHNLQVA